MGQGSLQEHRLDSKKALKVLSIDKEVVARAEDSGHVWQRGEKYPGVVDRAGTWV